MKNTQVQAETSWLRTWADNLGLHNGRRDGLYLLQKVSRLGDIPERFEPMKVLHEDRETVIRINSEGGERRTRRGLLEFPGLVLGGPVTSDGIFLFGYGTLIYMKQEEERWFELCAPEHSLDRKYAEALFVPYAELHVNGGIPVLTTRFE